MAFVSFSGVACFFKNFESVIKKRGEVFCDRGHTIQGRGHLFCACATSGVRAAATARYCKVKTKKC